MKLAISIAGDTIDAPFDTRFGRAQGFCVIDTQTEEWRAEPNGALESSGGAGVSAAQQMASLGVKAVVSGAFGPNAFDALEAAGIAMYTVPAGQAATAREVLARYQRGDLTEAGAAGERRGAGGGR